MGIVKPTSVLYLQIHLIHLFNFFPLQPSRCDFYWKQFSTYSTLDLPNNMQTCRHIFIKMCMFGMSSRTTETVSTEINTHLLLHPLRWWWAEEGAHPRCLAAGWELSSLKNRFQRAERSPRVQTPEVEPPLRLRKLLRRKSRRLRPLTLQSRAEKRATSPVTLCSYFYCPKYWNIYICRKLSEADNSLLSTWGRINFLKTS